MNATMNSSVGRDELEHYLSELLNVQRFRDYAPNGLQVEGKANISKLLTGVTACQRLLDVAVAERADAVLVHHGYFWKNESPAIRGMKKQRIATLIKHDISLFAYHLPLDAHPELGNNARLGDLLGIKADGLMDERDLQGVGQTGYLAEPLSLNAFGARVKRVLQREPLLVSGGDHLIKRIAWCTGGAQGYISQAHQLGVDAYLSGEVSENTVHSAREQGIHYIAAGHHATERYGAMALGEHLAATFGVQHLHVDVDNPA